MDKLLELDQKTFLTADGKVLKHLQKLKTLNLRVTARRDVSCFSWQIERLIRRDLNLVFIQLCKRTRHAPTRRTIHAMITDIMSSGELFNAEVALSYPAAEHEVIVPASPVPVFLCTPDCSFLLRAMLNVDRTIGQLNSLVEKNLIDRADRDKLVTGFLRGYYDLKLYLSAKIEQSDKSMAELKRENRGLS